MNAFEKYELFLQTPKKKELTLPPSEIGKYWNAIGKFKNPKFKPDEITKTMVKCIFESNKGVLFAGSKGIGKTLNLDIFCKLLNDIYKIKCEAWEAVEIETTYRAQGASFIEDLAKVNCLIINDLGGESMVFKDFGTDRNIIFDLLFLRYRIFQTKGYRTYITTNMGSPQILTRYGDRMFDRFQEMFEYVEIKGASKR